MNSQQQNENILFSSPSPSTIAEDHARISQAGAFVALSKGPLLMLSKPNRNERLSAAAAAAIAACEDGDGDDGGDGDASSEPVLAACYPNPGFTTGPANDDRLISSILGAMPSLPGSPTVESTAAPGASRLVQRPPDAASIRRYANATSGTFSGGGQTGCKGVDSPVIAKSQSDRVVAVSRLRGSSGCAVAAYDDAAAVRRQLCAINDVARESVDAAADAVTLTTRQVSELSLAVAAVAGADEDYDEEAAAAEGRPALLVSINAAEAAALARAKGSLDSSAGPSPSPSLPPPQANGDAAFRANLTSAAQYRIGHGHSVNAVAPLLPLLSTFDTPLPLQAGRNLQNDRPQARCATSAAAGCTNTVSEEEGCHGGGEARSGEVASRQRPKWLERLLRAFHANRQLGGGKGTSSEEDSKESSSGGSGGYGGGGGIEKMPGDGGDGGKSGAAHGDMQPEDSDGGGDGRDGGRGVGRAGIDGKPDGHGGAGAGAADAVNVTTATSVRSTRDQLTRLLSSRLSHRPRSRSEELPLTVTASRDSTTVHRARLAQHAREPRVTTPSITQQRIDGGVLPRSAGARYGIVGVNDGAAALIRKHDTGGNADGAAPVMGTAHAHAACDFTTSVTAPAAVAFEFSRPVDFRQVRSTTPAGGAIARTTTTTTTTTTGRRGGGSLMARRLRQFSAPGGPELQFTPLSQMETHSVGGADWPKTRVTIGSLIL